MCQVTQQAAELGLALTGPQPLALPPCLRKARRCQEPLGPGPSCGSCPGCRLCCFPFANEAYGKAERPAVSGQSRVWEHQQTSTPCNSPRGDWWGPRQSHMCPGRASPRTRTSMDLHTTC